MTNYSILKDVTIRNSKLCAHASRAGYEVIWNERLEYQGWSTYNGVACFGVWDRFMYFTLSQPSQAYIQTTNLISPTIDCSKYDHVKVRIKIDASSGSPTYNGKLQWQNVGDSVFSDNQSKTFSIEADGEWHVVDIDLSGEQYWVGSVDTLRIYPATDGAVGDDVFLSYLRAEAVSVPFCTDPTCSAYTTAGCSGSGAQGYCEATTEVTSITIVQGTNDKLTVNIDGYGAQTVVLPPVTDLPCHDMARIIEKRLGSIAVGGYLHVEVDYTSDNVFRITSGTRAADSSVTISYEPGTAAVALGFYTSSGVATYTSSAGSAPTGSFQYISGYRVRTIDIHKLYDGDYKNAAFTIDPDAYSVEGGRRDYATVSTRCSVDASSNTYIDINHPITEEGTITKFYMKGVLNSGSSKYKVFRPSKDGNLTLVAEGSIGTEDGNYFYTANHDFYSQDVSISVRPGDLLGFYDGIVYAGSSPTNVADAEYYLISGDATGTFDPGVVRGRGERGAALYVRSDRKQDRAVLDVDFSNRKNISSVYVYGYESSVNEEYNIATALDANIFVTVFGEHYHLYEREQPDSSWISRIDTHTDVVYNETALNDGVVYADNGVAGDGFESSSSSATYMYINGDFEWPDDEYVPPTPPLTDSKSVYGFEDNPFNITANFGIKKDIHRGIIYFKENSNVVNFQWQYYLDGYYNGDGSTADYMLVPSYTAVKLDDITYSNNSLNSILYENPTEGGMEFSDNTISNPNEWSKFNQYRYYKMSHEFSPVNSSRMQFRCTYHWSTKISEFEVYSKTVSPPTLEGDVSIYFSDYGDIVGNSTIENVTVTGGEYGNSQCVRGIVGYSPQYMRIYLEPFSTLEVREIDIVPEHADMVYGRRGIQESVNPTSRIGTTGPATAVLVKNDFATVGDLHVDIASSEVVDSGLVLGSSLSSASDVANPSIGAGGRIYLDDDLDLRVSDDIAINCNCYGLDDIGVGKPVYRSVDGLLSWQLIKTLGSDKLVGITNSNANYTWVPDVYCAIDLGRLYNIDLIDIYGSTGYDGLWSSSDVDFSDSDTTNPMYVSWGNSDQTSVRWVRFHKASANPAGGVFYELRLLRMYPKIQVVGDSTDSWENCTWTYLNQVLTDGNTSTSVNSTAYPVVCLDLGKRFAISGHTLTSVNNDAAWGNSESAFAYSSDSIGPNGITWTSYGAGIPDAVRWVAIKNTTRGEKLANVDIEPTDAHHLTANSRWFDVAAYELLPVATISGTDTLAEDTKWGESSHYEDFYGFYAFDGDTDSYWAVANSSGNVWRVFDSSKNVKRVSITIPTDKWSVITDYSLQYLQLGGSPTNESDWVTIESYTDQSIEFGFDPANEVPGITENQRYIDTVLSDFDVRDRDTLTTVTYTFESYYTTSGIRLKITDVYSNPYTTLDDTIFITDITVYEQSEESVPSCTISTAITNKWPASDGEGSLQIEIPEGTTAVQTVQSVYANLGTDSYWSDRDYFNIKIYVDNISNLDTTIGGICLGNASDTYYQWNWGSLSLSSGWNMLKLQFVDADYKTIPGVTYGSSYDIRDLVSNVDFLSTDIDYFAIKARGLNGAAVQINVDDLVIERCNYDEIVKFNTGLYLNNNEAVSFPLTDLDLTHGTVEFWMRPDWDTYGYLDANTLITPTIFRIYNGNNDVLAFMLKQGFGFSFTVSDDSSEYLFQSNPYTITKNDLLHVGVTWSSDGTRISSDGSTIRIYINGLLHYKSNEGYTWSPARVKGTQFILGGSASDRVSGTIMSIGSTPSTTTSMAGVVAESCWAVIENLKIHNYCKTDYSDINVDAFASESICANSLIQISSDGTNFYSYGDSNLPLVYTSVPAGTTRTVYVRNVIPRLGLTGREKRTAHLVTSLFVSV